MSFTTNVPDSVLWFLAIYWAVGFVYTLVSMVLNDGFLAVWHVVMALVGGAIVLTLDILKFDWLERLLTFQLYPWRRK